MRMIDTQEWKSRAIFLNEQRELNGHFTKEAGPASSA